MGYSSMIQVSNHLSRYLSLCALLIHLSVPRISLSVCLVQKIYLQADLPQILDYFPTKRSKPYESDRWHWESVRISRHNDESPTTPFNTFISHLPLFTPYVDELNIIAPPALDPKISAVPKTYQIHSILRGSVIRILFMQRTFKNSLQVAEA